MNVKSVKYMNKLGLIQRPVMTMEDPSTCYNSFGSGTPLLEVTGHFNQMIRVLSFIAL